MRTYRPLIFLILVMLAIPALLLGAGRNRDDNPPPATTEEVQRNMNQSATELIENWPDVSQRAANEMIQKYGQPDMADETHIMWFDEGNFKEITVYRDAVEHNFPMPHEDVLEHVVYHEVPADKLDDLANFDGSVIVYRTGGLLAARCGNEASNIATLNLAHQIIMDRTTPEQARQQLGQLVQSMQGQGGQQTRNVQLQFSPMSEDNAADPGQTFQQMGGQGSPGTGTTGRGDMDTTRMRDTTSRRDTTGIRDTIGTGTGRPGGTGGGTGTGDYD